MVYLEIKRHMGGWQRGEQEGRVGEPGQVGTTVQARRQRRVSIAAHRQRSLPVLLHRSWS